MGRGDIRCRTSCCAKIGACCLGLLIHMCLVSKTTAFLIRSPFVAPLPPTRLETNPTGAASGIMNESIWPFRARRKPDSLTVTGRKSRTYCVLHHQATNKDRSLPCRRCCDYCAENDLKTARRVAGEGETTSATMPEMTVSLRPSRL